jgi:hypothetical protein
LSLSFPQLAFVLYNDQPPQPSQAQDSSRRGHTKGEEFWIGGWGGAQIA